MVERDSVVSDFENHEQADFKKFFSFDQFIDIVEKVKAQEKEMKIKDKELNSLRIRVKE